MLDFNTYDAISFDCYGTLIDWETGILTALRSTFPNSDDATLLGLFARFETEAQVPPFKTYREVLGEVTLNIAETLRVPVPDANILAESLADWPAFPDTAAALRSLSRRFKLCIFSNVDDDLFQTSLPKLGVTFDQIVTAQQVRSYKPAHDHFQEGLRRLGIPKQRLLHVAQSKRHDIVPCNELAITSVWVNRSAGTPSASGDAAPGRPDLEIPDMATLALHVQEALA